jgi:hypothetical protein
LIYLASVRSEEMDEIKERFRTGGIPVYIAPDYSISDGIGGIGVSRSNADGRPRWYKINICLDHQLEEGKRLFDDANYKVMAPVDVVKFEATMDKLGANRDVEWRLSNTSLNWLVGIVILGLVLFILRAVLTTS